VRPECVDLIEDRDGTILGESGAVVIYEKLSSKSIKETANVYQLKSGIPTKMPGCGLWEVVRRKRGEDFTSSPRVLAVETTGDLQERYALPQ
jgi:hypothetical protein